MSKKIIILDSHYKTRTFLKAFKGKNIYLISVNKYEKKTCFKKLQFK